ncbi:MAG TPA: NfeD family protein [Isosphaeraceae bacterium]|jgi:hypothetical protein
MDRLLWGLLEFLDVVTLGTLSRWGAPDPDELRAEAHCLDADRLEVAGLLHSVGTAATPLRPSGKVTLAGRTYDATSEGGFIVAGSEVEVIGRNGPALIVRTRPA